jgi:hypothetical protein
MHAAAIKATSSPRAASQLLAFAVRASAPNKVYFFRFTGVCLRSSLSFLLPVTMATYAAYRHIELDKVGYSKKR